MLDIALYLILLKNYAILYPMLFLEKNIVKETEKKE